MAYVPSCIQWEGCKLYGVHCSKQWNHGCSRVVYRVIGSERSRIGLDTIPCWVHIVSGGGGGATFHPNGSVRFPGRIACAVDYEYSTSTDSNGCVYSAPLHYYEYERSTRPTVWIQRDPEKNLRGNSSPEQANPERGRRRCALGFRSGVPELEC